MLNIPPILQIALLVGSFFYLLFILLLLKKGKLNVQYSIIWFGSAFAFLLFSAFPYLLAVLGNWLGVQMPSNLVFIMLFAFVLLLLLSLSTIVTGFAEKTKKLAQTQSLLEKRIRELEQLLQKNNGTNSGGQPQQGGSQNSGGKTVQAKKGLKKQK